MMRGIMLRRLLSFLLFTLVTVSRSAAAEKIDILRDTWGVPHIFAESDEGAFYGLGYCTAEDRGFQMTFSLRIIQGRLSEVIGEVKMITRNDTSLDLDRKMRTFGFYRAAEKLVPRLDEETRALLQAYSDGVNAWFADHAGELHPLFAELSLAPEPWTPADCLVSWWHMGQFFATDGTRDVIAGRNQDRDRGGRGAMMTPPEGMEERPPDDTPAVVKRRDVTDEWLAQVMTFAREYGMMPAGEGAEGPKFSHAWVVGGTHTSTGSSVLVSDPQTPVRNPSLFYEFHLRGETMNVRGIGVPGSPVILIGFNEHVAWGVTALGADQADLFFLETDDAHPDQYRFDGEWRPMQVVQEPIRVKGGRTIDYRVRETHLGPVATQFCYTRPDEGEVALKRIPVSDQNCETIQGAIGMMRAGDAEAFSAALEGWRFPSVNILFGDSSGNIGYRTLAAVPIRSAGDPSNGRSAFRGRNSEDDWRGFVPYALLPQVMNPEDGFLYSGNHRPVESWYPIPFGAMTGTGGDTVRSWRLRERLQAQPRFTPEEVRNIHFDTVNPARREIVRIGLHLRDVLKRDLDPDAGRALVYLKPWYDSGASSSFAAVGSEIALELNTFFRFVSTPLAFEYGGGESGLAYFLKTAAQRLDSDEHAEFSEVEKAFIETALADAWRSAVRKYGQDPDVWNQRARAAVKERRLGYYESLDGFPSLDRAEDLPFPALMDLDGGTIASQASQSYTQWVPMHDPDSAMTILPIGQSERPGSPWRTSTMDLWARSQLHPAPLSREKVEEIATPEQRHMLVRP